MFRFQIAAALSLLVLLLAQNDDDSKRRKVYRTQSGSIIEAPRPIFERDSKKKKSEPRIQSIEKNKPPSPY